MKTTKEKAAEWNCSEKEVREYCLIIPNAYKDKNFPFSWQIPDVSKPPFKPQLAVKYIQRIELIKEGADLDFESLGYSLDETEKFYKYLSDNGYITPLEEGNSLNSRLSNSSITSVGRKLVEKFQKKPKNVKKTTTKTVRTNIKLGFFKAEASTETVSTNEGDV